MAQLKVADEQTRGQSVDGLDDLWSSLLADGELKNCSLSIYRIPVVYISASYQVFQYSS